MRIRDPWKAFDAVLAVHPEPGPSKFSWLVFADGASWCQRQQTPGASVLEALQALSMVK